MLDGTLNATVECNPISLGSGAITILDQLFAGHTFPKTITSAENVYEQSDAEVQLPNRKY